MLKTPDGKPLYICDRKKCKRCYEECGLTTDINHAINRKEPEKMIVGDLVKCIKNGQEGVIIHVTDGCYFVQFNDDPSGCLQIFVGGKQLQKIGGINFD